MVLTDVRLPALGEGITEATLTRWLVKPGDVVQVDMALAEIATDKVDSEVLSPVEGIVNELLLPEHAVPKIGQVLLRISAEGNANNNNTPFVPYTQTPEIHTTQKEISVSVPVVPEQDTAISMDKPERKFISPYIRQLAIDEGITLEELYRIPGTGLNARLTKEDLQQYILSRKGKKLSTILTDFKPSNTLHSEETGNLLSIPENGVPMDRIRKLIARNMVESKRTAPHVTVFSEVDVTKIVHWRQKNKSLFQEKYGENVTFTPIFLESVAKALKDHPGINISVQEEYIIYKKDVNIGLAVALPDGNLIVPVIKNAGNLALPELAHQVNDLSRRARIGKLKPTEIQDGTFTITNIGAFGNISGTPIINLPQVAILAIGTINTKPATVEVNGSKGIGLREIVTLSLSFDHRVVDGALGGTFLQTICNYISAFDENRTI